MLTPAELLGLTLFLGGMTCELSSKVPTQSIFAKLALFSLTIGGLGLMSDGKFYEQAPMIITAGTALLLISMIVDHIIPATLGGSKQ